MEEEELYKIWESLGLYISKNLRCGRAVHVPKLGTFTYSAPQVNLYGTTNENERHKDVREPVFIVSKDFAKGLKLKSAVYRDSGLRPLVISSTAGKIQTLSLAFNELGV